MNDEAAADATRVLSPDELAKVSEHTLTACRDAARQLREIGEQLSAIAARQQSECEKLADDFERHAEVVTQRVVEDARMIQERGVAVSDLRKLMPRRGPVVVNRQGGANGG